MDPMSSSFTPRFSQPFSIADLEELDTALISQEIQRLQKSIALLESTNSQLLAALSPSAQTASEPLDDEDAQIYRETLDENAEAMEKQGERVQMCIFVLKKRLGVDPGNAHYEINERTTAITPSKTPVAPLVGSSGAPINTVTGSVDRSADHRHQASQDEQPVQDATMACDVADEDQQGGMYL